jgi:hypothetical protein
MRDTQQLNSVLAVLRHADVQHRTVWPPQVSMLWLGGESSDSTWSSWTEDEDMARSSHRLKEASDQGDERSKASWLLRPMWPSAGMSFEITVGWKMVC